MKPVLTVLLFLAVILRTSGTGLWDSALPSTSSSLTIDRILFENGIRTHAELRNMTSELKRDTLIVEINSIMGIPVSILQNKTDVELCFLMPIGIRFLENSSFEQYITHYLSREAMKKNEPYIDKPLADKLLEMKKDHDGKLRDWFMNGYWTKIEITNLNGLKYLLALIAPWTEYIMPDHNQTRILGNMAEKALRTDFFNPTNPTTDPRQISRYQDFKHDLESFYKDSDIVLCSLDDSEKEEVAGKTERPIQLYLHDGIGRCLPFYAVVAQKEEVFKPVSAFCVFKRA